MIASSRRGRGAVPVLLAALMLPAQSLSAQQQEPAPTLYWKDHIFRPGVDQEVLPAKFLRTMIRAEQPEYYLVQFRGPVTRVAKARLLATGAEILNYVPENAFIVRMDGAIRERVEALEEIRWTGVYEPGFRISNSLRASLE